METYLQVRKTQINLYRDLALYYRSKDDGYVLYKKAGDLTLPVKPAKNPLSK